MTRRLRGGGNPEADDPDPRDDPRRLAALVPRYGSQRHPAPDGESTDPLIPDDDADERVARQTYRKDTP